MKPDDAAVIGCGSIEWSGEISRWLLVQHLAIRIFGDDRELYLLSYFSFCC